MRRLGAPILLVSCFALATSAAAGDLRGTWVGAFVCKLEDANGRSTLRNASSTLEISQPGGPGTSPIHVRIDGVDLYSGSIVPSASKPTERGVGALVACGTSDTTVAGSFSEIELIHWKVDPVSGRGSIRKSGVFVTTGVEVGDCKGGWVRSETADPGIGACPP
jgi:hypothetical protein